MPNEISIDFCGETMVLRADRTLYWPAKQTLLFADLHAGKAEHLRRYGSAVPSGVLETDMDRLATAAAQTGASRVLCLGDLFHSDVNTEWDIFAAWSRQQPFELGLVRGNHDRFLSDALVREAGLKVWPEPYQDGPFALRHHPVEPFDGMGYTIAGHLHPVVRLTGPGHDHFRLACFWQQERQLILPAFGSLTGGFEIRRKAGGVVYGCSPDEAGIIEAKRHQAQS